MTKPQQTLRLTPQQLATILVFEAQLQSMSAAIAQLTWVSCTDEAAAMTKAQTALAESLVAIKRGWDTGIVLAAANSVIPNLERVSG